ncbi:hypothetical protein Cocul_00073 [Corynebacterium oculi]|uniref:Uncharacterized protein n=1 Tax=Corynebacterium oculi TaxID=1544416 RepID=A0A0Q1DXI0_9CORY|nr:hypothetical protein Cocul_00073 [Corynebacterium oculi]
MMTLIAIAALALSQMIGTACGVILALAIITRPGKE